MRVGDWLSCTQLKTRERKQWNGIFTFYSKVDWGTQTERKPLLELLPKFFLIYFCV